MEVGPLSTQGGRSRLYASTDCAPVSSVGPFWMRDTRPSLAYRLQWLFPPVGLVLFAFVIEGPKLFDFDNPRNLWGGVAMFAYFVGYAAILAKDAVRRRS